LWVVPVVGCGCCVVWVFYVSRGLGVGVVTGSSWWFSWVAWLRRKYMIPVHRVMFGVGGVVGLVFWLVEGGVYLLSGLAGLTVGHVVCGAISASGGVCGSPVHVIRGVSVRVLRLCVSSPAGLGCIYRGCPATVCATRRSSGFGVGIWYGGCLWVRLDLSWCRSDRLCVYPARISLAGLARFELVCWACCAAVGSVFFDSWGWRRVPVGCRSGRSFVGRCLGVGVGVFCMGLWCFEYVLEAIWCLGSWVAVA